MLAYQILQDESCPTCGTPVWLGHNEDNTLGFDVEDATCYACSELESAREKVREEFKGREHMRFGVTEYVVPRKDMGTDPYGKPLPPGPLPSRTEAFEAMELRRAELAQVAAAQQEGIF